MKEIDEIKKDWDDMAEINAAWFNVPSDRIMEHKWEIESFFQTGKTHIKKDLELINNSGIILSKGVVLDFGCGIGRITQALADEFETCYGVDVSPKMIQNAIQHNRFGERCKYIANPATDLRIFEDSFFDFIYSNNALQHNPPAVIKSYLHEFLRTLKTTGVLMFQIPIQRLGKDEIKAYLRNLPKYHPKRVWNKLKGILIGHDVETRYYRLRKLGFSKKWLFEKLGLRPHINMYFLEESELRDLFEHQGWSIKHTEQYQYKDMIHAIYVVVKSS